MYLSDIDVAAPAAAPVAPAAVQSSKLIITAIALVMLILLFSKRGEL